MFQVIEDRDDLSSFAKFLAQDRKDIRDKLENTSAAAVIDPGAHDSGGGQAIISVATLHSKALRTSRVVTRRSAPGVRVNGGYFAKKLSSFAL
jgi:hypothetical protein